jgi:hypothetical protein
MIEEISKEYIALISNIFGSFSELNKDSVELSHMLGRDDYGFNSNS